MRHLVRHRPWASPMVRKIPEKTVGKSQTNFEKIRRILRKFRSQSEIFMYIPTSVSKILFHPPQRRLLAPGLRAIRQNRRLRGGKYSASMLPPRYIVLIKWESCLSCTAPIKGSALGWRDLPLFLPILREFTFFRGDFGIWDLGIWGFSGLFFSGYFRI